MDRGKRRSFRMFAQAVKSAGLAAICLGTILSVAGCGAATLPSSKAHAYSAADIDARLVSAYNDFGFDLYRTTAAGQQAGKNAFMSPASVAIALSMTMNGAAGPTRDGMAQTLGLQGLTPDETNKAAHILQNVLRTADPSVQLSIANSIWARKELKFNPDFLATNKNYYGAVTESLDFAGSKAAATINKWVKKETKGRIDSIVDNKIDPQTIMFLLNAVYFKGDWTVPFEKSATRDRPFTLSNGTKASRSMMDRRGTFDYADMDGYAAVRLPYGNGNTGTIVLLPDEGMKLPALTDRLIGSEWLNLTGALQNRQGEVILPRFKLEYESILNEPLKALGMSAAFDRDKADFSGLLVPPPNAYIGEVKHKSFVQVDEKGTEAAAVTKVESKATSAPASSGFMMEMNRPFLFVIHERQTGTVLFIGSVYDPGL
ncbi:serpin family protein [Paenibacillus mesophilus]|uniref:serpin family protein n=1 Tax=Paenibacillus mesophilus TaxID=2582849 RepID=UPI0013050E67|nr:serpin family protein [Paenibacillus mesophilus]